ncbi:MAG: hypothetical protein ACOY5B_14110 [Spirochaetota bacterium]
MRRLLLLICLSPVAATVVVKKNGDVISGRILQEKTDRYVFRSPYGQLQIRKSDVSRLILDEKTLELRTIRHDNKAVQARLVAEDNNTRVYLTDDGRTIRQEQAETQPPAARRHRYSIGINGGYGASTFQQIETEPPSAGSGMPPLSQSLKSGVLQSGVSAQYNLSAYFGLGLSAGWLMAKHTETLNAQSGQISYDSTVRYNTLTAAPVITFSIVGNLGHAGGHDLRLEFAPGYAYSTATMDLALRNTPGNFPTAATASGEKHSLAGEIRLVYLAPLSENLHLRIAAAYLRLFQSGSYTSGLTGNTPFPNGDGFKRDFDANLAAPAANPQVITAQLGLEYGF